MTRVFVTHLLCAELRAQSAKWQQRRTARTSGPSVRPVAESVGVAREERGTGRSWRREDGGSMGARDIRGLGPLRAGGRGST